MSGLDLDALRAVAEAAGGCGMVNDCDDPAHEWYGYSEMAERLSGGLRTREAAEFIASTPPSTVLALLDLAARAEAAERERHLLAQAMWDAREALGFDTDGDKTFHSTDWQMIARNHVREAEEARRDHDEALADTEAEKALARVEALADEWARSEARRYVDECAGDIRDAIASEGSKG